MKLRLSLVTLLVAAAHVYCQQPATAPSPTLPKDPRALIEAARSHYDFADMKLRPWHLKGNYQLYDVNGKAAEEGSWEYWWGSPNLHRSTEERAGASQTLWAAADGKVYRKADGSQVKYFERNLDSIILDELPWRKLLDPSKSHLAYKIIGKVLRARFA